MLLRLFLDNFTSFSEETEFNTFPNTNLEKHQSHVYNHKGIDILKMIAIYGANASGKSNLINALSYLKNLVIKEKIPDTHYNPKFALAPKNVTRPFKIAVEFIFEETGFIYGVEIDDNEILCEELYESGLGKKEDQLIFKRFIEENNVKIKFFNSFYDSEKNKVLLDVLEENLLKKDKPVLKFLSSLLKLDSIINAFEWFNKILKIIRPNSVILGLSYNLYEDSEMFQFANKIMNAYHVGIDELVLEKFTAEEFFGKDNSTLVSDLKKDLEEKVEDVLHLITEEGNEVSIVNEDGILTVLQIKLKHHSCAESGAELFSINEESDGTKRLLDFIPAFFIALNHPLVFCIDEIDQSIHPVLVKELINKFSNEKKSSGQIIFTTHESNLLDQDIFRRDEIWFTEKQKYGSTELYSLNSFKEHNTKNIRKGYLNGRYGAVPFLGNLKDLNWLTNDPVKKS